MSDSRNSQIDNDEIVWDEDVEDVNPILSPALIKKKRDYRAEIQQKNALKKASSSATSSSASSYILPSPSEIFLQISKRLATLEEAIIGIEHFIRSNKQNTISDKYQLPIENIKDNFIRIKDLFEKNMQREGHSKNYEDFLVFTNEIEGKSAITFLEDINSACAELKKVSRNLFKDNPETLRELEICSHNFSVYIKTLRDDLTQKFDREKQAKLELDRVNAENLAAVTETLKNIVNMLDQEFTNIEIVKEMENKIKTWKEMPKKHVNYLVNSETCKELINEISNSSMEESTLISHLENFIKSLIHFCEHQKEKALKKLTASDTRVSASSLFSPTPAEKEKEQAAFINEANTITIGNLYVLLELTQWRDCKLDDIAKTLNTNMEYMDAYPDHSTKGFLRDISNALNKRLGIEKKPSASASSSVKLSS